MMRVPVVDGHQVPMVGAPRIANTSGRSRRSTPATQTADRALAVYDFAPRPFRCSAPPPCAVVTLHVWQASSSAAAAASAWARRKPRSRSAMKRCSSAAVRIVGGATAPVVVVAALDQTLPELAGSVRVVRDRHPGRGPLEGLLAGLTAVSDHATTAFVIGCDAPLLVPAFIGRMLALLGEHDIAVPYVDDRYHPLAATYRTRITPHIERLLAADRRRMTDLFEHLSTRQVTADELRDADPTLASLRNVNRPAELQAALVEAGLASPMDRSHADIQKVRGSNTTPSPLAGEGWGERDTDF